MFFATHLLPTPLDRTRGCGAGDFQLISSERDPKTLQSESYQAYFVTCWLNISHRFSRAVFVPKRENFMLFAHNHRSSPDWVPKRSAESIKQDPGCSTGENPHGDIIFLSFTPLLVARRCRQPIPQRKKSRRARCSHLVWRTVK